MKRALVKYQKLLPVGLFVTFLLGSLFYVAIIYRPTVEMSINDGPVTKVKSRNEAEIDVYKALPFKATFQLTTGESLVMDMRFLGLSYFSPNELTRLDSISTKSFWGKFVPFFDTNQNQLISVYPNRIFWLTSLQDVLNQHPELLRQEPETNHLVVDEDGHMIITENRNGYMIDPSAFVTLANEIVRTGNFDNLQLESTVIEAEDQSRLLSAYPNFIQKEELQLPDDYNQKQNIKTGFSKMQNIYISSGETLKISDLLGKLDADSGYFSLRDGKAREVYGVGVEQLIDTIQKLAHATMTVQSYKGQFFDIGDVEDGLTELVVQNTTANDVVISLSILDSQLSVLLASK